VETSKGQPDRTMSFFKKLRNKLFKSSEKIDEGLEAIVAEAPAPAEDPAQAVGVASDKTADPVSEPGPEQPDKAVEEQRGATDTEQSETKVLPTQSPAEPDPDRKRSPAREGTPSRATPLAQENPSAGRAGSGQADNDRLAAETRSPTSEPGSAQSSRPGLLGRVFGRKGDGGAEPRRVLDDAMLESLEELLIQSDMGVETALRVAANLAEGRMGRKLSVSEIKALLSDEVARIMEPVARPMPLYPTRPQVVLVVGVNGSGKTTTIGKLASQFRAAGKKVVIAAGDTFRAAAVEQLQVWGERAGVPVMTAPEGSDPASLAFDAMTRAQADGADLLMIDTAGRLQNRQDLMEELAKIVRVIRKKDPSAPHNTLLVLDATTGQNALNQVDVFRQIADVSGLVMTKLDGTAKGGVLVALADRFGLPIHAIGVGEQIDDLDAFDPQDFARALVGAAD
jgi:fused signal recognition particle receptor